MESSFTSVIIPAYNEAPAISHVIENIPSQLVNEVIVVDNGSTDQPAKIAQKQGARVIFQPERGYGNACLAGIANLNKKTEIVIFLDGDYSDNPHQIADFIKTIHQQNVDLVLGSRVKGVQEARSLTVQQKFGNWLAVKLIKIFYGHEYTDLGPFRAINREKLRQLNLNDPTYGWTVEMQIKALQRGFTVVEIPVDYRRRLGKSKISGTLSGTIKAGIKILWTIAKLTLQHWLNKSG